MNIDNQELAQHLAESCKEVMRIHADGLKIAKKNKLLLFILMAIGFFYTLFEVGGSRNIGPLHIIVFALILAVVYYLTPAVKLFPRKSKRDFDNAYKNNVVRKGVKYLFPNSAYTPFYKFKKAVFERSGLFDAQISQVQMDDCISIETEFSSSKIVDAHIYDDAFQIFSGLFVVVEIYDNRQVNIDKITRIANLKFKNDCQINKIGNNIYIALSYSDKLFEQSCMIREFTFEKTFADFSVLQSIADILAQIDQSAQENSTIKHEACNPRRFSRTSAIKMSKKSMKLITVNTIASFFLLFFIVADYFAPFKTTLLTNQDAKFNCVERSVMITDYNIHIYTEDVLKLYAIISETKSFAFFQTPIFNIPMYIIDLDTRVYSIYNVWGGLIVLLIIPIVQFCLMLKNRSLNYMFFSYSRYLSPFVNIAIITALLYYLCA